MNTQRKVARVGAAESDFGETPDLSIMELHGQASARALADSDHSAETIARRAMKVAADLCVYTNEELTLEAIEL